jgi:hypothetical protein
MSKIFEITKEKKDPFFNVGEQIEEVDSLPYLDNGIIKFNKELLKSGHWTNKEHQLFLEALRLYRKDWDKI